MGKNRFFDQQVCEFLMFNYVYTAAFDGFDHRHINNSAILSVFCFSDKPNFFTHSSLSTLTLEVLLYSQSDNILSF